MRGGAAPTDGQARQEQQVHEEVPAEDRKIGTDSTLIRREGPSALLATPMTPAAATSPTPIQRGTRTSRAEAARAGTLEAMARHERARPGCDDPRGVGLGACPYLARGATAILEREYLPVRVVLLDGADEENAQGLGGGEDARRFGAPAR